MPCTLPPRPRARGHRLRLALLLLATLVSGGCELAEVTVAEPVNQVLAEIYLRVTDGRSDAVALVYQTGQGVALEDVDVDLYSQGVRRGRLFRAPLSTCFEGSPPPEFEAQCLRLEGASAAFIRPGVRIRAEITLPGGGSISGETTLPGGFELLSPANRVCRLPAGAQLPVRWTPSAGARAYIPEAEIFGLKAALAPQGIEAPDDPLTLLALAISEADTSVVFPAQFGIFNRFSSDGDVIVALQRGFPAGAEVFGDVVVSAQDRNSVNWNRGGNFNPSGTIRVPSLFGDGTGVLAGIVNRSFTFTTRNDPQIPPCL